MGTRQKEKIREKQWAGDKRGFRGEGRNIRGKEPEKVTE